MSPRSQARREVGRLARTGPRGRKCRAETTLGLAPKGNHSLMATAAAKLLPPSLLYRMGKLPHPRDAPPFETVAQAKSQFANFINIFPLFTVT